MAAERGEGRGGGAGGEATPREGEQLKRAIGPGMLLFFVLGDILGAGIYARVGSVSREVGGAIWLSFLVALVLAALTALSYMELVTKYPGAAGAALYVNKAFKVPFFTFMDAAGEPRLCAAVSQLGQAAGASLAKVETRVWARGPSASHAATRRTLSAVAISRCSRRVFARPR